jgi:hypothetical protein
MNQSLYPDLLVPVEAMTAAGLFTWSVTIQKASGTLIVGQPDGNFVDAELDLVGLPCRAAPPSPAKITANEIKAIADILSLNFFHVLIGAPYPQIRTNIGVYNHAVLTDPLGNVGAYEIMGCELDSVPSMTRLTCRVAAL